jgi:hypothetical protein
LVAVAELTVWTVVLEYRPAEVVVVAVQHLALVAVAEVVEVGV